jgi:ABC-type uncharacterized transport system fused permease/ATPase subunit
MYLLGLIPLDILEKVLDVGSRIEVRVVLRIVCPFKILVTFVCVFVIFIFFATIFIIFYLRPLGRWLFWLRDVSGED